jgi:flagellar motility protein MotE (MotC chaperone)
MSGKALGVLIAGMSVSFLAVLVIMTAFMEPGGKPRSRRRVSKPRIEESRQPATTGRQGLQARAKAADAATTVAKDSIEAPGSAVDREREAPDRITKAEQQVRQAARAASEFKIVRKELRLQIASLKQERQLMLAELARALAAMSVDEAADQVEALDDAGAVEVLRQTPRKRRTEILEKLAPARARTLRRKL